MSHKNEPLFMLGVNYEGGVTEAEINNISAEEVSKTDSYQNLKNSLTKRSIGLYILKLLANTPKYGYELKEAIKDEFEVITSQISTYKALYKLNDEGLITCRLVDQDLGNRTRKYYFITPMGLKLLNEAKKFLQQTYSLLFGRYSDKDEILS